MITCRSVPRLALGASVPANRVGGTGSPGEILAYGRARHDSGLHGMVGVGTAFTPGAGAAAFRAFVGLGWGMVTGPNPDRDGDGILTVDDDCPGLCRDLQRLQR